MQNRSSAYQAIISITLDNAISGIPYNQLVERVATYIDPERARTFRLNKLKRTPHEANAETTAKGQREIARRYIDAACRQGLILYGESPEETSGTQGRYVYWRRFARNGGRYGAPEKAEELQRHQEFMSGHRDNGPDPTGGTGTL